MTTLEKIDDLGKEVADLINSYASLTEQNRMLQDSYDKLTSSYKALEDSHTSLLAEFETMKTNYIDANDQVGKLVTRINEIHTSTDVADILLTQVKDSNMGTMASALRNVRPT